MDQKQQAADRIKQANNILVTVSNNPSVDQLAACIGLTISLNKMGKHATAVFSGQVPSTIEFLQPEKTLEKNTDSLRDFIIALDKSKADKLRYKVEDRVVKIFITPYKTSINEKDLEFSQGDFNVDVVLALGVHNQADLDQAITSHGRILHDATVVTLNIQPGGELGSINWLDPNASSLSELAVQLIDALDKKLIDGQISTAFLTGIVAETERFSNARTSPQTMSISAELMANGANQQLVATKLEEPAPAPQQPAVPIATQGEKPAEGEQPAAQKTDDGTLEISHEEKAGSEPAPVEEKEKPASPEPPAESPEEKKEEEPAPLPSPAIEEKKEPVAPQIHIDEHGSLSPLLEDMLPPKKTEPPIISHHSEAPKMVLEPPVMGGQLTATGAPDTFSEQPSGGGGSLPQLDVSPMSAVTGPSPSSPNAFGVGGEETPSGGAAPADSFLVGEPSIVPPNAATGSDTLPSADTRTLTDIERDVQSPHLDTSTPPAQSVAPVPVVTPTTPAPAPTSDAILPPLPSGSSQPQPVTAAPSVSPSDTSVTGPSMNPATDASTDITQVPDVSGARDAVAQALESSSNPPLEPIQALNAQPVNLPMGGGNTNTSLPAQPEAPPLNAPVQPWAPPSDQSQPLGLGQVAPQPTDPGVDPLQSLGLTSDPNAPAINTQVANPSAPPPLPPPMMPPANPY